ncbi:MAG: hypothetical protein QOJ59_5159 [Thermomicrobiales bacterium]|nr:hypothetical protein [Thermomicrobiales bacterium]
MAHQFTLPPLVRGEWLPMTSDEFDAWVPDGMRAEWVDGKGMLFVTSSERHVLVGVLLTRLLATFLEVFDLGVLYVAPFEMRLRGGASRREPDLFVVLQRNRDRTDRYRFEGPADFVIELVSEHSVRVDRFDKLREYEAAGVPEYLLIDTVDPERDVEFYRLNDIGRFERVGPDELGRHSSQILPGVWFDSRWFQQEVLPIPEDLLLQIAPDAYSAWLLARIAAQRGG